MRIDAKLVKQKGQKQSICDLPSINKKLDKRKMPKMVQKLYQTCKEVFANGGAGFVPPPEDIERLRLVLDRIKPTNVGLLPDMPYFDTIETEEVPPVTCLRIYACDTFSICIFCLPPSAVMPLHNHPGMTVFSKLLFGSMHVKSYDWVADAASNLNEDVSLIQSTRPEMRLAKIHKDSDFTAPCDTSILFPTAGGNMHSFRALTSCAILDVLGPPYDDSAGRHCAHYNEFPYTSFSGLSFEEDKEGYAWLEEREKPEDFVLLGAPYRGPRIIET